MVVSAVLEAAQVARGGRWLARCSGSWDTASRMSSVCGVWLEIPRGKKQKRKQKKVLLPWTIREHEETRRCSDCVRSLLGTASPGKAVPLAVDPDRVPARPSGTLVGLLALSPAWPCFFLPGFRSRLS